VDATEELGKSLLEMGLRPEKIKMVRLDLLHHDLDRLEMEEIRPIFTGLYHEKVTLAQPSPAPPASRHGPHDYRWIAPRLDQQMGSHSRGGRLSVRACNCQAAFAGHHASDHLKIAGGGDAQAVCLPQLRVFR
jgi:hypothetical protein